MSEISMLMNHINRVHVAIAITSFVTYITVVVAITNTEATELIIVTIAIANNIEITHVRESRRGESRRRNGRGNWSRHWRSDRSRNRSWRRNKDSHGRSRNGRALGHVVGIVAVITIGHRKAIASWHGFVGGTLEANEAGGAF